MRTVDLFLAPPELKTSTCIHQSPASEVQQDLDFFFPRLARSRMMDQPPAGGHRVGFAGTRTGTHSCVDKDWFGSGRWNHEVPSMVLLIM